MADTLAKLQLQELASKYGLNPNQLNSGVFRKVMEIHENDLDKMAHLNAEAMLADMREAANNITENATALRQRIHEYERKIETLGETLQPIIDAAQEYGSVISEKGRDALALYAALLKLNRATTTDGVKAVEGASYVVYAFLGGQATRSTVYTTTNKQKPDKRDTWEGWEEI